MAHNRTRGDCSGPRFLHSWTRQVDGESCLFRHLQVRALYNLFHLVSILSSAGPRAAAAAASPLVSRECLLVRFTIIVWWCAPGAFLESSYVMAAALRVLSHIPIKSTLYLESGPFDPMQTSSPKARRKIHHCVCSSARSWATPVVALWFSFHETDYAPAYLAKMLISSRNESAAICGTV